MFKTSLFIPPIHDRYMIDVQNREHELNLSIHNNNYTLADSDEHGMEGYQ